MLRLNPLIDIIRVGDPGVPVLGTLDPEILSYLEVAQRMIVTSNRKSMPDHLNTHWSRGGHLWGLCWIRPGFPVSRIAQDLVLIYEATTPEDWIDRLEWIPF